MRTRWTCVSTVSLSLTLMVAACAGASLSAQGIVLAKVSIGMSEQQVIAAIGPEYHLKRKTYSNLPDMTSLFADTDPVHHVAESSEYEFTFVDQKLEAFKTSRGFLPPNQPLATNIYRSVADKLGDAPGGAPRAGNGYWILDTQGHVIQDSHLHDECFNSGAYGLPPVALHDPKCGLWVRLASVESQGVLSSTSLTVVNEAAFNKVAQEIRQAAQQRDAQQKKQADKVASPF